MGATVSNPIALGFFLAMVAGLLGFLGYAWVTRYRLDWDKLLRRWSRDRRDREPPPEE